MEELQEFNEAVLASAGSGAALAGGRHLQRLAKKKKTKCSFPDLMGIFTGRWVLAAVPAVHVLCCWQPSRQLWPSIPTQPAPHAGAGAAGSTASSPCPPPVGTFMDFRLGLDVCVPTVRLVSVLLGLLGLLAWSCGACLRQAVLTPAVSSPASSSSSS